MRYSAIEIIVFIAFAVCILFMVALLCGAFINATNEIDAGIIVDKMYDAGGAYFSADKHGGRYYDTPPSYRFTIEGEKNGKTVKYTFEVTEDEYNAYKIGDWYER